jgi:hypothetical protein
MADVRTGATGSTLHPLSVLCRNNVRVSLGATKTDELDNVNIIEGKNTKFPYSCWSQAVSNDPVVLGMWHMIQWHDHHTYLYVYLRTIYLYSNPPSCTTKLTNILQVTSFGMSSKPSSDLLNIKHHTKRIPSCAFEIL